MLALNPEIRIPEGPAVRNHNHGNPETRKPGFMKYWNSGVSQFCECEIPDSRAVPCTCVFSGAFQC